MTADSWILTTVIVKQPRASMLCARVYGILMVKQSTYGGTYDLPVYSSVVVQRTDCGVVAFHFPVTPKP